MRLRGGPVRGRRGVLHRDIKPENVMIGLVIELDQVGSTKRPLCSFEEAFAASGARGLTLLD